MSIEALFDHEVRVYRPTEGTTDYGAAETLSPVGDVPTGPNAAIVPPKLGLQNVEAGERPSGTLDGYMAADADVSRRDILDVTSGPEAPTKLRVLSLSRPRGHHTELRLEPYTGDLS